MIVEIPSQSPVLSGQLTTLRPIDPKQDAAECYDIMKDPHMHEWTGNRVPKNMQEIEALLRKYKTMDGLIAWTIEENTKKRMIGTYWIAPTVLNNRMIVSSEAQRIGRKFWRRGFTREARTLVYHYAFGELGVEEIHAGAWANNINSCRSMEAAGFQLLDSQEKTFPKYGRRFVENHYVLYKEKWLAL